LLDRRFNLCAVRLVYSVTKGKPVHVPCACRVSVVAAPYVIAPFVRTFPIVLVSYPQTLRVELTGTMNERYNLPFEIP